MEHELTLQKLFALRCGLDEFTARFQEIYPMATVVQPDVREEPSDKKRFFPSRDAAGRVIGGHYG